jgi:hypothetical protein
MTLPVSQSPVKAQASSAGPFSRPALNADDLAWLSEQIADAYAGWLYQEAERGDDYDGCARRLAAHDRLRHLRNIRTALGSA